MSTTQGKAQARRESNRMRDARRARERLVSSIQRSFDELDDEAAPKPKPVRVHDELGRNERCPCGQGEPGHKVKACARPRKGDPFPIWTGTNHTSSGIVRRMTRDPKGRWAPLRVVSDLDDTKPSAAGFNLLGQVVRVLELEPTERVEFAAITKKARKAQTPDEMTAEAAYWRRTPRLTAPGMDIDIRDDLAETEAGRTAAFEAARRLIAAELAEGILVRASWSGGEERGRIHLDWGWSEDLADPNLLRVMLRRARRIAAAAGVATTDDLGGKAEDGTPLENPVAWVDLVPLRHYSDNRGRLWRPLGGLHKNGVNRKALIDGGHATATPLTRAHLSAELAESKDEGRDRKKKARRKRDRFAKVVPLKPVRQSELGPLATLIANTRASSGQVRQEQRLAWAAALLLAGLSELDAAWTLSRSVGNAEAAAKVVRTTRQRLASGATCLGLGYLERTQGTALVASFVEVLARVRRVEQNREAKAATGGLDSIRELGGLSRTHKKNLLAYAEGLEHIDASNPAAKALARVGLCRQFHERMVCGTCSGSKGKRRLACEDELCAWCHGTRVLHERAIALQAWTADPELAKGTHADGRILVLAIKGFATLADADAWYRARDFRGVHPLRVRTLDAVEDDQAEDGIRLEHGMLVLSRYSHLGEAYLHGARIHADPDDGLSGALDIWTVAGAAEAAGWARWSYHVALRAAVVAGAFDEAARIATETFRRQGVTRSKKALTWPGREDARASIMAEVAARALEDAEAGEHGGDCDRDECPGCPGDVVYELMSSGKDDAEVLHRSPYPHGWTQARRLMAEHARREAATSSAAVAKRKRTESRERVPF